MAREKRIAYTYKELLVPTYEALLELGGSGTNDEICAQGIKAMNLPDDVVDEPHLGNINQTELEYQLAWARTYLKNFGVIVNSGRSVWAIAPCGSCRVAMQERYLEILDFTQFFDHFVFTPNAENVLEKELKREIPVSVGIELVVVDMSRNA